MNRGSAAEFAQPESACGASMRPRFMNRGSYMHLHLPPGLTCASMRPRFMNRGSTVTAAEGGRGFMRFNEAPIHESGK